MPIFKKPALLEWTLHAQAKMRHYRLSPSRVRHVLHTPKRQEEGIAPKTVAFMQPASMKTKDTWSQEIWVMVQDTPKTRKVISAWRYPGVTKLRAAATLPMFRQAYNDFIADVEQQHTS